MNQSIWMFVVTYPEWLNWIAVGRIRCSGRLACLKDNEDERGFHLLMDRAPDISINDDQAFILAKLKPGFRNYQQDVASAVSSELVWLSIEAVDEFIPVSERGARLIEADAQRAKAKISTPRYQNWWKSWSDEQKETRDDYRGRSLVKVMGLGEPDLSAIPVVIFDYLIGSKLLPKSDKARELSASKAFSWASSFSTFAVLTNETEKQNQNKELNLNNIINVLKNDFDLNEPILNDLNLRKISNRLSEIINHKNEYQFNINQVVVIFHYNDLIYSGKEISLASLVNDVGEIYIESGRIDAANTVYMIGRRMDDIAVTTLVYSDEPQKFPSLVPSQLPCSLDVHAYLQRRQSKIEEQALEEDLESTPLVQEDPVALTEIETEIDETGKVFSGADSFAIGNDDIACNMPSIVEEANSDLVSRSNDNIMDGHTANVDPTKDAHLESQSPLDPQIRDEPVEEKEIVSGIEEVQAIPTEGDTHRKPVLKKTIRLSVAR